MKIDVSVIMINYNTANYTISCIKSIIKNTKAINNYEIIVVDNASKHDDFLKLSTYINTITASTAITLFRSKINTGFGGGNMLGAQLAIGNYFAFINNDVILNNDCLTILKDFMEKTPNAGVCGPQAFTKNHKILPTIDHFASPGREIYGRSVLELINPKKYPKRKKLYKKPQQGQFIAGSFMFFNAAIFRAVGGFDTNLFLYYEETDICKRLLNYKKLAFLVPQGRFIHYHGASTPKSITLKVELKISLLYVIRKHYGFLGYYVLLTFLRIKYAFSTIFKPKNWPVFYAVLKQAPLSMSLKHKQSMLPK